MMPAPMIFATASHPAVSTESKAASTTCARSGLTSSLTVTSTTMPSRPSEPVISASRS
jgi:hypothetical protein